MTPDYGWRMKATGILVLAALCAPMFWFLPWETCISVLAPVAVVFLIVRSNEEGQSR